MPIDKHGNPIDPVTFDTEGDYYAEKMEEAEDDLVRIGQGMFGSANRFRIMCWIAQRKDVRFYGALYWEETKNPSSAAVGSVLPKLAALGLIEREEESGKAGDAGRCVWYRRRPHPAWRIIEAANDVMAELDAGRDERDREKREKANVRIVQDLVGVLAG